MLENISWYTKHTSDVMDSYNNNNLNTITQTPQLTNKTQFHHTEALKLLTKCTLNFVTLIRIKFLHHRIISFYFLITSSELDSNADCWWLYNDIVYLRVILCLHDLLLCRIFLIKVLHLPFVWITLVGYVCSVVCVILFLICILYIHWMHSVVLKQIA